MGETERNERGEFEPTKSDRDVLDAVRQHDPAKTAEVGEALGIRRHSADYRLRKLHDAGRVGKKKIAASLVWFIPREHIDGLGETQSND
jgi:DNA-binding Lrp family transcriptional regulator